MDYAKEKEKLDRQLRADREHVENWYRDERRKRVDDQNREWKANEHKTPPEQEPIYERHQEALRSLDNLKEQRMQGVENEYQVHLDELNKRQQEQIADQRNKARETMNRIQGQNEQDRELPREELKKQTPAERMNSIQHSMSNDRDQDRDLD